MVKMKNRFNRMNSNPSFGHRNELLSDSVFVDEVAYDVRSDTYKVLAKRNIIKWINASADAVLSVGQRVEAFLNGDMMALNVDRSGVYMDLNGLPTNEHQIHNLLDRANAIVREKNASSFSDAIDKITAEQLALYQAEANKTKSEVVKDEQE